MRQIHPESKIEQSLNQLLAQKPFKNPMNEGSGLVAHITSVDRALAKSALNLRPVKRTAVVGDN